MKITIYNINACFIILYKIVIDVPKAILGVLLKRKPKVYDTIQDEAIARFKKEIRSNWLDKYARW